MEYAGALDVEKVADYLTRIAEGLREGVVSLSSSKKSVRLTPTRLVRMEVRAQSRPDKSRGSLELEISWEEKFLAASERLEVTVGSQDRKEDILIQPGHSSDATSHHGGPAHTTGDHKDQAGATGTRRGRRKSS